MRKSNSTMMSQCVRLLKKLMNKVSSVFQKIDPEVVGEGVTCLVCCTRHRIKNSDGVMGSPDKDYMEDHLDKRDGRKEQCGGAISRIATGRHKGRMLP